ncbi:GNAT family N-acetyltransferase [Shouchella clausii]|uniref:GNAT family N-acetyltransferase n=1 Tax=Shouchella clausii TaxID=79880 RepID=A0A268S3I7_SHOCL|nr:GNAT family N-acetyltransferase [Shouchella clausii]PAD41379.1 GNAT family N-acetyltransferase [Bacillus sp. 7520-S]SPU17998.1 GCN5-like N-acetyltransferase [Niallia circulans]AST95828.1 GNAT family N-acetyltransferase [Shouchella clausii]MCM3547990.1 GNAT family N-acetyltransferase [Shouchella clausii]MCY1106045.1 GNAT family N-acetyltransferase [Shouchella clausii]
MIAIRRYSAADYRALLQIQKEAFPPPFPSELWWTVEQVEAHAAVFPAGALLAEINGEVAGSATSLLVSNADRSHTWEEISDNGLIRASHQPDGDTLYGIDLCVRPRYRGKGVAAALYEARKQTVIQLGLTRFAAVCRIPGYHAVSTEIGPEQYVSEVKNGKRSDQVLSFMMKQGLTPTHVLNGYVEDAESLNYGVFVEWRPPVR